MICARGLQFLPKNGKYYRAFVARASIESRFPIAGADLAIERYWHGPC
jgi:hypothetical protein